MAPSPEVGQPKAPDKVVDNAKNDQPASNDVGASSKDHIIQKSTTTAASATAAATTTTQDTENFSSWDDTELKKLLDEAITYKRPKDREHKSETFKELLHTAELEDKATRNIYSNCIYTRGSNRHTQGRSLQDLFETEHNEHQFADAECGPTQRPHNSRQKKYSLVSSRTREGSSLPSNINCNLFEDPLILNEFNKRKIKNEKAIVIAGGVGGIGTGNSVGLSIEDSIGKVSHTVIEIGDVDIDETSHLLAHDSLAQGISDSQSGDETGGTELNPMKKLPRVAMNYQLQNLDVTIGEGSRTSHHYHHNNNNNNVDNTVLFNSLKSSSNNNNKPIENSVQLNNSYVAVNSCMDGKTVTGLTLSSSQNGKFATYPHTLQFISEQKQIDENGNSLQSFNSSLPSSSQPNKIKIKNKINKADRNTKTLIAKEIKGNRGNDNIELLLAFIENKDVSTTAATNSSISSRKNGVIAVGGGGTGVGGGGSSEKGTKKKSAKKEHTNKLKKSNSLEELKSSSKLEDEIAQSGQQETTVTLRHKNAQQQHQQQQQQQQQQHVKKSTAETKESSKQQQQQKRGERRSWGTEELTYLGENNSLPTKGTAAVAAAADEDVQRVDRKTKDKGLISNNQKSKKDEHSLSIVSIESISTMSETAEFHVVTKKKKAKKRQILEEARQKQMSSHGSRHNDRHGGGDHLSHGNRSGKYQPSQYYQNDRDAYLTPFNSNDNRRKSTSSVPPSEKSDSSDLDSVHSLPIESTSSSRLNNANGNNGQQTSTSSGSTPQASYADIARISNPDKGLVASPMDKWPAVSGGGKNPESSDNSNMSTCSSISAKSQNSIVRSGGNNNNNSASNVNKFFPSAEPIEIPNINNFININNNNNNAIYDASSCSSTSSNSTIVKQISYSQSLIDDKQPPLNYGTALQLQPLTNTINSMDDVKRLTNVTLNNNVVVVAAAYNNTTILPTTTSTQMQTIPITNNKLIEIIKNNASDTLSKSPLQKSKSVDNDNYVNIDHYPALEKTVKPQKQYQSMPAVETNNNNKSTSSSKVSTNSASTTQPNNSTTGLVNKSLDKKSQKSILNNKSQMNEIEATNNLFLVADQTKLVNNKSVDVGNNHQQFISPSTQQAIVNNTAATVVGPPPQQPPSRRNTKKDKNQDSNRPYCGANRPAVIILNDPNSKYSESNISPLLFGDFNEDELRLLEQESEQPQFTTTTKSKSTKNQKSTTTNDTNLTSPQSDLGYSSSSHNRSTQSSESIDNLSISTSSSSTNLIPQTNLLLNVDQSSSTSDLLVASNQSSSFNCVNNKMNCSNSSNNSSICGGGAGSRHQSSAADESTLNNSEPIIDDLNNISNSSSSCSNSINNIITSCNDNINIKPISITNWNDEIEAENWERLTLQQQQNKQSSATKQTVAITTSTATITTTTQQKQQQQPPPSSTITAAAALQPTNTTTTTTLISEKELNVRYIEPPSLQTMTTNYNHDKIVSFIELAWTDIMGGKAQYYNGQQ